MVRNRLSSVARIVILRVHRVMIWKRLVHSSEIRKRLMSSVCVAVVLGPLLCSFLCHASAFLSLAVSARGLPSLCPLGDFPLIVFLWDIVVASQCFCPWLHPLGDFPLIAFLWDIVVASFLSARFLILSHSLEISLLQRSYPLGFLSYRILLRYRYWAFFYSFILISLIIIQFLSFGHFNY